MGETHTVTVAGRVARLAGLVAVTVTAAAALLIGAVAVSAGHVSVDGYSALNAGVRVRIGSHCAGVEWRPALAPFVGCG